MRCICAQVSSTDTATSGLVSSQQEGHRAGSSTDGCLSMGEFCECISQALRELLPKWAVLQNIEDRESLGLSPCGAGGRGIRSLLGLREGWRRWESMN